jgi:hypothetical protein
MSTPSGKLGSLAITSTRPMTTVSVSSGTSPAARRRSGRSAGRSCPCSFHSKGSPRAAKDLHLPRDQRVEFVAVEAGEVAVLDEAAIAEAERSHKWPIALDADGNRKPVVHVPAQLRVVGGQ